MQCFYSEQFIATQICSHIIFSSTTPWRPLLETSRNCINFFTLCVTNLCCLFKRKEIVKRKCSYVNIYSFHCFCFNHTFKTTLLQFHDEGYSLFISSHRSVSPCWSFLHIAFTNKHKIFVADRVVYEPFSFILLSHLLSGVTAGAVFGNCQKIIKELMAMTKLHQLPANALS